MIRITGFACLLAIAAPALGQSDEEVAARLTPAVHACENAPENGGTLQQALCYRDEAARQDKQLNATWAQVMARMSAARRQTLRQSERRWIKQRDEDCNDEANGYVNSTAAYMFHLCMANSSIRRIIWLERAR